MKSAILFYVISGFCSALTETTGEDPQLNILPAGPQEVRRGKNLVLTCRAAAPNLQLIRDLRWFSPDGALIPQDERIYSEDQPGEAATALFIKHVRNEDAGEYTCRSTYAANQQLFTSTTIQVYVGITWDDAPLEQYATLGEPFKIRCAVRAEPPASIDWIKQSQIISSGDQFVIENDGLLIQRIRKEDSGMYTCRARVQQTGELEERDIMLEVQEPPVWIKAPQDVEGVESERVELECSAGGSPLPVYAWVGPQGQDPTTIDGWRVDEQTGTLTAYQVYGTDRGEYKCIAENNAGRIEASATLSVIVRPKIENLYNATFAVGAFGATLTCSASGQPLPNIIWRKWSSSEPLIGGGTRDPRISVNEHVVEAPSYTSNGEAEWLESTLNIDGVLRTDDGLYECMAENKGGTYFKSGHITVEFPPTFEDQPIKKEWSWDEMPVNVTCIATSIPNATISWWYNDDIEIGRDDLDQNYQIIGRGPASVLRVTPSAIKYYREYKCRAENPLGAAEYEIELEEAREPGVINQAKLEEQTATSLVFRFSTPTYTEGLPIDSYAVEYKESRREWNQATRDVWPAGDVDAVYTVEGLIPLTTYDLRFSARNRVGFSPWGASKQITTESRGVPEIPHINRISSESDISESEGGDKIIESSSSREFEVSWTIPGDNGAIIDYYTITYSLVRREGDDWVQVGDFHQVEVRNVGTVSWKLENLYPGSYYRISVQAHNELGFSEKDSLVIRTKQESGGSVDSPSNPPEGVSSSMSLVPILVVILMVSLVLLVLIDLSCCKVYQKGVTYSVITHLNVCKKLQRKERRKHSMPGQKIIRKESGETVETAWAYSKSTEDLRSQQHHHQQHHQQQQQQQQQQQHQHEPEYDHLLDNTQTLGTPSLTNHTKRKFTSEWVLSSPGRDLFVPNLYDVTPDHSILKNGLAKSLSQMYLDQPDVTHVKQASTPKQPLQNTGLSLQQVRLATSSQAQRPRLVKVPPPTLPKPNQPRPNWSSQQHVGKQNIQTTRPHSEFMSDARLSNITGDQVFADPETESSAISPDWKYYGSKESGKKMKDFGDFQIFSDSPIRN